MAFALVRSNYPKHPRGCVACKQAALPAVDLLQDHDDGLMLSAVYVCAPCIVKLANFVGPHIGKRMVDAKWVEEMLAAVEAADTDANDARLERDEAKDALATIMAAYQRSEAIKVRDVAE